MRQREREREVKEKKERQRKEKILGRIDKRFDKNEKECKYRINLLLQVRK
jgi:hypothetical protein